MTGHENRPYRIPMVLWFASVGGLVLALVTDGYLDMVGLALLAAPLVVSSERLVRALSR